MKLTMTEWETMEGFLKKNKLFSSSLNKAFHKIYHCEY